MDWILFTPELTLLVTAALLGLAATVALLAAVLGGGSSSHVRQATDDRARRPGESVRGLDDGDGADPRGRGSTVRIAPGSSEMIPSTPSFASMPNRV